VQRELVLRLASILWRLRRATTMETGLFEIQATHLCDHQNNRPLFPGSREDVPVLRRPGPVSPDAASANGLCIMKTAPDSWNKTDHSAAELARCFVWLANLPNFALDRSTDMKQIYRVRLPGFVHALETLERRKPHERGRHQRFSGNGYERNEI